MPTSAGVSAREVGSALLGGTVRRVLAVAAVGALFWGPFLYLVPRVSPWPDRLALLLIVLGNQAGCLLVGLVRGARAKQLCFQIVFPEHDVRERPTKSRPWYAILTGVLGTLLAVMLGIIYDMLVRSLLGADAPTIGPYGAVRQVHPVAAGLIVAVAVSVGPLADETFFRAGIFRAWASAGVPRLGALVSSILFAVSRLDMVNFPAYVGLGLLLCAVYHYSGSLLAPLTTHVLNNAAMLVLLASGYQ